MTWPAGVAAGPRRELCSDTAQRGGPRWRLCRHHTNPLPGHPQGRSHRLDQGQTWGQSGQGHVKFKDQGHNWGRGIGGLTFAGVKGGGGPPGVPVEEGLAELTVAPGCVVLTCIAHTSTHVARCKIHGHVKVTTAREMPINHSILEPGKKVGMGGLTHGRCGQTEQAMAPTLAGVGGTQALLPATGAVLVQALAAFTVGTSGVVAADTMAMHLTGMRARSWPWFPGSPSHQPLVPLPGALTMPSTLGGDPVRACTQGMAVAQAAASNH